MRRGLVQDGLAIVKACCRPDATRQAELRETSQTFITALPSGACVFNASNHQKSAAKAGQIVTPLIIVQNILPNT